MVTFFLEGLFFVVMDLFQMHILNLFEVDANDNDILETFTYLLLIIYFDKYLVNHTIYLDNYICKP